jgi:hypothetical protein
MKKAFCILIFTIGVLSMAFIINATGNTNEVNNIVIDDEVVEYDALGLTDVEDDYINTPELVVIKHEPIKCGIAYGFAGECNEAAFTLANELTEIGGLYEGRLLAIVFFNVTSQRLNRTVNVNDGDFNSVMLLACGNCVCAVFNGKSFFLN